MVGLPADSDVTVIGGTWGFPTLLEVFQNNLLQDLNAFKSLKVGGAGNSFSLKKLKEYYAYKLEKVLSDGTAAPVKKKKGLTARSVACAYMLYVLGSFLFPMKKGTNINTWYLDLFAKDKVANKWLWGSAVLAHTYYNLGTVSQDDGRQFAYCTTLLEHHEYASLSPNAHDTMPIRGGSGSFDLQITVLNDQLQKLKEDKENESKGNIDLREALKEKRKKLVNAEEGMNSLEVNNSEWEVWSQTLKKALASKGMGDIGDPTFEELFEQNEIFFTIAQQGPKGDYQEDLVFTAVTLENVIIARREKMAKKKKIQ
ncbi:hypothetical protein GIB67_008142 [Kingdonia uniflora]|uniref:Aminotransferase-like plant mobile domain-containing protein n=1 Tax=Kingdonia uniflora TaxID=39325 RepID=A0A7J7MT26_9MAGN|nr:hypothetical protein GIB67_008142 [Kingdonia uniflora]